jgi:hypothetical protein
MTMLLEPYAETDPVEVSETDQSVGVGVAGHAECLICGQRR